MADDSAPAPNPNQPSNYNTSPVVNTVAPVIAQITGGDMGNTLAGVQGAQKAGNSFFGDIGASIAKVADQLSTVFQAGKQVGAQNVSSNPATIAQTSADLAASSGTAALVGGNAKANVTAMDALHAAAAAAQTKAEILQMGLEPNNPTVLQSNENMRETSRQFTANIKAANEARSVGFFDNPAQYLINHIVNLPIAESRAQANLRDLKAESDAMTAQTAAVGARSAIDNAMNSKDTTDRAAQLYVSAQAEAAQAGIKPLMDSQQTQLSAWHLGVSQGQLAVSQSQLAISQADLDMKRQMFPLQLQNTKVNSEWAETMKQAKIEEMTAQSEFRRQEAAKMAADQSKQAELISGVNSVYHYLGAEGNITDLNKLSPEHRDALVTMSNNLSTMGSLAQSPSATYKLLVDSGVPLHKLPANQFPTVTHLGQMYATAKQAVLTEAASDKSGMMQRLSPKDLEQRALVRMDTNIFNESHNMTSTNKFYQVPSLDKAVTAPWAASNPLMQQLRPMAVDSTGSPVARQVDGTMLMQTAAQLVAKNKLTAEQATAALGSYAENTLNDIQSTLGFKRFGIPVFKQFPMTYSGNVITTLGSASKSGAVDLLNPADTLLKLKALIGSNAATDAMIKMQQSYGNVVPAL